MKQASAIEKDLMNLCTLDNRTPLVFLAFHPCLQYQRSSGGVQQEKSVQEQAAIDLMALFTEHIKDEKQILVTFDMIARRHQLHQFNHLRSLVNKSSLAIQGQILHLACRHNNATFLKWLLSQELLVKHLNTVDYAGYTPLLTATFYKAKECVEVLNKVCFYFS